MNYQKWFSNVMAEHDAETLQTLAKRLRLHPSAIYKMMKGEREIYASELPIILRTLSCDPPADLKRALAELNKRTARRN